ncbi:MAG: PAC2 family protein [Phycisphaerales bacterium]|nr:MAG: PAC2 family protein [Phycisphaerales bacterium]
MYFSSTVMCPYPLVRCQESLVRVPKTFYCRIAPPCEENRPTAGAHTWPRRLLAVYSQQAFQKQLRRYGIQDMEYQGLPVLNSYLVWLAKERAIRACSLWTDVPSYPAACDDLQAAKIVLSFFDARLALGMDFQELDKRITHQQLTIDCLQQENPATDALIASLETGLSLGRAQQIDPIKQVSEALGGWEPARLG